MLHPALVWYHAFWPVGGYGDRGWYELPAHGPVAQFGLHKLPAVVHIELATQEQPHTGVTATLLHINLGDVLPTLTNFQPS